MYSKYSGYVLFIQYLVKLSDVALTLQLDHVHTAADVRNSMRQGSVTFCYLLFVLALS